jgi:glyoxylase-like metal-dependent hydrolase (beta-lactamase superfamily II)
MKVEVMKQTRYGNVIQLTRLWWFNSYLVVEDDGLTVVDTNLPGSAKHIHKAAQSLNLPIRRVVLTHAHSDHAASADDLLALVPDAELITSARTKSLLAGDMTLLPGEPVDKLRGGYVTINSVPDRTVSDDEMIGSLRVVDALGHTPGQIALLDTRDDTLIAADAYQTQFRTAVSGTMVLLFPFPAMATWHKPTALQSAQRLCDLTPSRLAVGHGPVLENPVPQMERAIAEAHKALNGTGS